MPLDGIKDARLAECIVYVLSRTPDRRLTRRRLLATLWHCDKSAYIAEGTLVTESQYVHGPSGICPENFDGTVKELNRKGILDVINGDEEEELLAIMPVGHNKCCTDQESNSLDSSIITIRNMDDKDIDTLLKNKIWQIFKDGEKIEMCCVLMEHRHWSPIDEILWSEKK